MSAIDNIKARQQARKNVLLWKIIAKQLIDQDDVTLAVQTLMEVGWAANATDAQMAEALVGVVVGDLSALVKNARMTATLAIIKK